MQKRLLAYFILLPLLSGCVHQMDIEQGKPINAQKVAKLHTGMNRQEVKNLMGEPILTHTLNKNRVDYVYTLKTGNNKMKEDYVTLSFKENRLEHIGGNLYSPFIR